MPFSFRNKRILIIDRQQYWRDLLAEALTKARSQVEVLEDYGYETDKNYFGNLDPPDLVILGCLSIGPAERTLIHQLLAAGRHLMVFSLLLPAEDMRELFQEGADDVADKVYDQDKLIGAVEQVFDAWQGDSYHRTTEKGLL